MDNPKLVTHLTAVLASTLLLAGPLAAESVSAETLAADWTFSGSGEAYQYRDMFFLAETLPSNGAMIISPAPLGDDFRVEYEVMPMTAATVLVAYAGISNAANPTQSPIPDGLDGNLGALFGVSQGLFFAFHNAAHGGTPFVFLVPAEGDLQRLDAAEDWIFQVGRWHHVVVEKAGRLARLMVDGEPVLEAWIPDVLPAGHFSFRVRGSASLPASCLLRNIEIK